MNTEPLVSVVVRTFGGRRALLGECLASIGAQDYRQIEVIVVEDGSDEAREVVEFFGRRASMTVQYRALPKCGRCRSGNAALEIARGTFVNFLDDDDQCLPLHVGTRVAAIRRRPDLDAVYAQALEVPTTFRSFDPLVYDERPGRPFRGGAFSRARLWAQNFLPIQSVLFRRALFVRYGGFDPEMDLLEDWNLWTRYFVEGKVEYVDAVTSFFRVPAERSARLDRENQLIAYRPLAQRKQQEIHVTLSVAEMIEIMREYWAIECPPVPVVIRWTEWLRAGGKRRVAAKTIWKGMQAAARLARDVAGRLPGRRGRVPPAATSDTPARRAA